MGDSAGRLSDQFHKHYYLTQESRTALLKSLTDAERSHWMKCLGRPNCYEVLSQRVEEDSYFKSSDDNEAQLAVFHDIAKTLVVQSIESLSINLSHQFSLIPQREECQDLQFPFVDVWHTLASWSVDRLSEEMSRDRSLKVEAPRAIRSFGMQLVFQLCKIGCSSLYQLFQSFTSPGTLLVSYINHSNGKKLSEHQYQSFVRHLRSHSHDELFKQFPGLLNQVSTCISQWLGATIEVVRRLSADHAELSRFFEFSADTKLEDVSWTGSDLHNSGRSVFILVFSDSEGIKKIVYKPRSLAADVAYSRLIDLSNYLLGDEAPLKSARVLNKGEYGYAEFIEWKPCSESADLLKYYRNCGRLLGILYILGVTDCHYENFIAEECSPVLIDCETLLQPELSIKALGDSSKTVPSQFRSKIDESVLRTGMLPTWKVGQGNSNDVADISMLCVQPQSDWIQQAGWEHVNTDAMRYGQIKRKAAIYSCLPFAEKRQQFKLAYVHALVDGLNRQLSCIEESKCIVSACLEEFQGARLRYVNRNTSVYVGLIDEQISALVQRSHLRGSLALEKLARAYLGRGNHKGNWQLLHKEIHDISEINIPYFVYEAEGCVVRDIDAKYLIEGMIHTSGLAKAKDRLDALDAESIMMQSQLVVGSLQCRFPALSTANMAAIQPRVQKSFGILAALEPYLEDPYAKEALRLVDGLLSRSFSDDKGMTLDWLGTDLDSTGVFYRYGLIGSSCYSGVSGLSALLARTASFVALSGNTGLESELKQLAGKCMHPLLSHYVSLDQFSKGNLLSLFPSGFLGIGGILSSIQCLIKYQCHPVSAMPSYGEIYDDVLNMIDDAILSRCTEFDLLSGLSGLIGPLILAPNGPRTDLIRSIVDVIIHNQDATGGWKTMNARVLHPLTGLSHGTSGIVLALASAYSVLKDERILATISRAIDYEDSTYSCDVSNWPDFRFGHRSDVYMSSWCHGYPGILLSRILAAKVLGSHMPQSSVPLEHLVNRLFEDVSHLSSATTLSVNLCCGFFGLIGIGRLVSAASPSFASLEGSLNSPLDTVLARAGVHDGRYDLLSKSKLQLGAPGIFNGDAGIALALLEWENGLELLPFMLTAGLMTGV